MINRLPLFSLICACLVLGVVVALELHPAMLRALNPRLNELLTTTLARPFFSSTRPPPQSASAETSSNPDLADTRLTGIVTEPGRRIAIFAVASGDKPLKAAEGDSLSGWRIESITPREVSLTGPGGTKTLKPKFDPNLASVQQALAANAGARVPTPAAAGARLPVPPAVAAIPQPNAIVPANIPATPPRQPRAGQQQ